MKKMTAMVLAFGLLLTTVPAGAETAPAGQTITVKTKGLVCDFCVRTLEKLFKKREEIGTFSVDLTTKDLKIGLKEGRTLDDEAITKIVSDAGYNVEKIERS